MKSLYNSNSNHLVPSVVQTQDTVDTMCPYISDPMIALLLA